MGANEKSDATWHPNSGPLDPEPWVSWGVRYPNQLFSSMYFDPREGYSQTEEDYR